MADLADRYLECEVCCEHFDYLFRRPKLLTCGHTVCMACVSLIYDKAQREAQDQDGEAAFLCPIDREVSFCQGR